MKILAFEGIDQSGKETQQKLLAAEMMRRGFRVKTVSFPRYHLPIGKMIERYLKGEINLSAEAVHMLYEADRQDFTEEIKQIENDTDYLIIDRYILSNLAYGMAKGLDLKWLQALQEKVVKPDATFVLDITARTSFERKCSNRDRYESDEHLLNRVRTAYHVLGQILQENSDQLIYIIDANASPMEVHETVLELVDKVIG